MMVKSDVSNLLHTLAFNVFKFLVIIKVHVKVHRRQFTHLAEDFSILVRMTGTGRADFVLAVLIVALERKFSVVVTGAGWTIVDGSFGSLLCGNWPLCFFLISILAVLPN